MTKIERGIYEKINKLAETYVSLRGEVETPEWQQIRANLTTNNDKASQKLLEEFDLATEAYATASFFREIQPILKNKNRLSWLLLQTARSITNRWRLETQKSRIRLIRKTSAKNKPRRFTKKELENALVNTHIATKQDSIAKHLGVDVKTLKKYAAAYNVELTLRHRKKNT